jgi:hypothetical protein
MRKFLRYILISCIIFSNFSSQSPAYAHESSSEGWEVVNDKTWIWWISNSTMGATSFHCDKKDLIKKYVMQAKFDLTPEVKNYYSIKSKDKSAWINVASGIKTGKRFYFNPKSTFYCPTGYPVIFNWIPPLGIDTVNVRFKIIDSSKDRVLGKVSSSTGSTVGLGIKYQIKVSPEFQKSIVQASEQLKGNNPANNSQIPEHQNKQNVNPNSNNATSDLNNKTNVIVNPYNIPGVGRVLQDGTIEYGKFYGSPQQAAADLSSGKLYEASQANAKNINEARQICIASNLTSGNIAAATKC